MESSCQFFGVIQALAVSAGNHCGATGYDAAMRLPIVR